jgi:hypothetical protein
VPLIQCQPEEGAWTEHYEEEGLEESSDQLRIFNSGPPVTIMIPGGPDETEHRELVNQSAGFTYSFHGALIGAGPAVGTEICINLCHVIDSNCPDGAGISTRAASRARILINFRSHCHYLLFEFQNS